MAGYLNEVERKKGAKFAHTRVIVSPKCGTSLDFQSRLVQTCTTFGS